MPVHKLVRFVEKSASDNRGSGQQRHREADTSDATGRKNASGDRGSGHLGVELPAHEAPMSEKVPLVTGDRDVSGNTPGSAKISAGLNEHLCNQGAEPVDSVGGIIVVQLQVGKGTSGTRGSEPSSKGQCLNHIKTSRENASGIRGSRYVDRSLGPERLVLVSRSDSGNKGSRQTTVA